MQLIIKSAMRFEQIIQEIKSAKYEELVFEEGAQNIFKKVTAEIKASQNIQKLTFAFSNQNDCVDELLNLLTDNSAITHVSYTNINLDQKRQQIIDKLVNNLFLLSFKAKYSYGYGYGYGYKELLDQKVSTRSTRLKESTETAKKDNQFALSRIDLRSALLSDYFSTKNLTNLKQLVLTDCQLTDNDADEILKIVEANTDLEVLDLSANRLGKQFVAKLVEKIRTHTKLTQLIFSKNQIAANSLHLFSEFLNEYATIKLINLIDNPLQWDEQAFMPLLAGLEPAATAETMKYTLTANRPLLLRTKLQNTHCHFDFDYIDELALKLIATVPFQQLNFSSLQKIPEGFFQEVITALQTRNLQPAKPTTVNFLGQKLAWDEQVFAALLVGLDPAATAQAMQHTLTANSPLHFTTKLQASECTFQLNYSDGLAIQLIQTVPFQELNFSSKLKINDQDVAYKIPEGFFQEVITALQTRNLQPTEPTTVNFLGQKLTWDEQAFAPLLTGLDPTATAQDMQHMLIANNPLHFRTKLQTSDCKFTLSYIDELAFRLIEAAPFRNLDFCSENKWPYILAKSFFERLIAVLENSSSIVSLRFIGIKEHTEGVKLLATSLNQFKTLAHLVVPGFSYEKYQALSGEDLTRLLQSLKTNRVLVSLVLSQNNISDAISATLIDALHTNKTLTHLSLNSTLLMDSTAADLVKKIQLNEKKKNAPCNTSVVNLQLHHQPHWTQKGRNEVDLNDYKKPTKDLIRKFSERNTGDKNKLITAVENGNLIEARECLKRASIYSKNGSGDYLIHIAIRHKHMEIVRDLIKTYHYNLAILNKDNQTPLELAESLAKTDNDQALTEIITLLKNPTNNTPTKSASKPLTATTSKKINSVNPNKDKKRARDDAESEENKVSTNTLQPPPPKRPKTEEAALAAMPNNSLPNNNQTPAIVDDEADSMDIDELQQSVMVKQDQANLLSWLQTGNLYLLQQYAKPVDSQQFADILNSIAAIDVDPLHIAVARGDTKLTNWLLSFAVNLEVLNHDGHTPLIQCVNLFFEHPDPQTKQTYLQIAYALVKAGAHVTDNLLHDVAASGHYRLIKILLHSTSCDLNSKNSNNHTVLDIAVMQFNFQVVDRLLHDPRINKQTFDQAFRFARKQEGPEARRILALFEYHEKLLKPDSTSGIQWTRKFSLFYGASYNSTRRTLEVDCTPEHAYLAQQNSLTRKRLLLDPKNLDNLPKELDKLGNPVTASLVFIVSDGKHSTGQAIRRCAIRIELNSKEQHHVDINEDDAQEKEKIKYRANCVPSNFLDENDNRLTPDQIQDKYDALKNNNDPSFHQLFRHGEQALLDYLEQEENLLEITQKLFTHSNFVFGCKVYAVVLNIHTPLYPCQNCEVAILGEQNDQKSLFLQRLKSILLQRSCVLPTFSPLRMISCVSTYQVHESRDQVHDNDHLDYFVDLRFCNNNLILAHDESAFEQPQATQYQSRKGL